MEERASPFDGRVIAGLIIAGLVGFIGFWAISAFAPELGSGRNGQGHALSRSAVGFAGVVELARAAGLEPQILRAEDAGVAGAADAELGGLLILTPRPTASLRDIDDRLDANEGPVLIILPKYQVASGPGGGDRIATWAPLPDAAGVLRAPPEPLFGGSQDDGAARGNADENRDDNGRDDATITGSARLAARTITPSRRNIVVNPWNEGSVRLHLPASVQTIEGRGLKPVISVDGAMLVAEVQGRPSHFILADPDLLNNLALRDDAGAQAAVGLLRALAGPGEPIGFDVTLNGLGRDQRNLLRMAFTPPFLALTLCLIAAGALALWQGFVRFGPPWRAWRSINLGKRALVATNAQLIIQARRTSRFGARYGAMVRETVARRLHAPSHLVGAAIDQWLDRFVDNHGRRFSDLLAQLEGARSAEESVTWARALGQWRREVLRDGE